MYRIYFAGDLFDQKHLTGNFFLGKKIEELSKGFYQCALPQDWEKEGFDGPIEIRDWHIGDIMRSDLILLNFDGPDLDSGTVVEFMIAKMLDIPAVLLRTDIRSGVCMFDPDWNLMVEGYPRTEAVKVSSLQLYNEVGLEEMHKKIALSIISAFDKVREQEPVLKSPEEIECAYKHVSKMCGIELEKDFFVKVKNCGRESVQKNSLHV